MSYVTLRDSMRTVLAGAMLTDLAAVSDLTTTSDGQGGSTSGTVARPVKVSATVGPPTPQELRLYADVLDQPNSAVLTVPYGTALATGATAVLDESPTRTWRVTDPLEPGSWTLLERYVVVQ